MGANAAGSRSINICKEKLLYFSITMEQPPTKMLFYAEHGKEELKMRQSADKHNPKFLDLSFALIILLTSTNSTFLKDIYTNTAANRWHLINVFFKF